MVFRARRINNFRGTDREYIAYLESLVLQHPSPPPPPPSPPRSDVRDEAIDSSDGDEPPTDPIVFIPYKPEAEIRDRRSAQPRKKNRPEPRWEREMDEVISDLTAENWASRRKAVGVSSQAGILVALDMMIGGIKPQTALIASEIDLSTACYHPSTPILQLLNAFATTTAALKIQETFTTQMFFFRVFVFVSLCCVALQNGADQALVDKIMQKCVSDSSEKNLARLRNGALWVNRMMVALAADGLDYLAYELFVLWGRSISQYGGFADAGNQGFSYFKTRVPKYKPGLEIQASLPFWVPFIVKTIAGDLFSLPAICTALHYGPDSRIHNYPRYLDNYRNRRMSLPRPLSTEATISLDQFQAGTSNGHGVVREAEFPACSSIQALLEAAQQSDFSDQSAQDQEIPVPGTSTTVDGMAGHNSRPSAGLDLNTDMEEWDMSFFNDGWAVLFPME